MIPGSRSEGVERRRDRGGADLGPLRLTAWWQGVGGVRGVGGVGDGTTPATAPSGVSAWSGCLSHTGSLSQERQC